MPFVSYLIQYFIMKRKKEKSPKISEAVFRGSKTAYNFEVFPLDIEFQETPAVFVISHRKTDRFGRGHHKLICVGQTESIVQELKKHKKGKSLKQNKANVICILAEQDEKSRVKIEEDLRSVHTVPCLH